MKIAVLWNRFGPYHLARVRGATEIGEREGVEIIGLEVAQEDIEYQWDVTTRSDGIRRCTIFPGKAYQALGRHEIRSAPTDTLDHFAPNVVAINGWAAPEARAALAWCEANSCQIHSDVRNQERRRAPHILEGSNQATFIRASMLLWWAAKSRKNIYSSLGFLPERILLGYDAVDNEYFRNATANIRRDAERSDPKGICRTTIFLYVHGCCHARTSTG